MFKKLFRKKIMQKNDRHPLCSPEGLASILASLPHDDGLTTLGIVDDHLDDIAYRADEIGAVNALNAALGLDGVSHEAQEKMLASYFRHGGPGFGSGATLDRLASHLSKAGSAYATVFDLVGANPDDNLRQRLVLAGERYFRAWGQHRRFGRFRQRLPGKASWEQAHAVMRALMAWGFDHDSLAVYRGEAASRPLQEYLLTVYEDTAPWGNLEPIQLEMAARLIRAQENLAWSEQYDAAATHIIDFAEAAGPRRCGAPPASPGPTVRFLSTARLHAVVEKVLALVTEKEPLPRWLDEMDLERRQMIGTLQTLASHWGPEPPTRQMEREGRSLPMLGAFGFLIARQLVDVNQNLAKGLGQKVLLAAIDTPTYDSELNQAFSRFGVGHQTERDVKKEMEKEREKERERERKNGKPDDPLVRIANLEKGVSGLSVENWTTIDCSASGLGVLVPALLPRHAPGVLVAWREATGTQWCLGVIRRVGRNAQGKANIGIEAMAGTPLTGVVHLLRAATKGDDAWDDQAEWVFAVLPDASVCQVLMPSGSFIPDMPVDILTDQGQRRVWLKRLVERHRDWEKVEFELD